MKVHLYCTLTARGDGLSAGEKRAVNQDEKGKQLMNFICYPKCSTCQKAKKWLDEHAIDYTNEGVTISSGGALAWDRIVSSVDDTEKMVSIVNAQAAQAQFSLQTPIGGSWIVSLTGDVNAFEVSPSTGIIDNQTATIYVKPLIASPTRDYKVQLKFSVRRSDGRMIAADNIIQANGIYTIVLPRNN